MNQSMAKPSAASAIRPGERLLFAALTLVVFATHLFLATRNWSAGQLSGHEFRQTQTALTTLFIQREHDFSLAYPTPVLGKPWSIPMEFPLYQWTVAVVGKATHWPLAEAGRLVALVCFYLTLPALYLLLGQLGLPPLHRLPGLCLALTCPLYIFYSRAFLIESMALMFAVWFAVSFVQAMRTHRAAWLAATVLCGLAAGLVKVTTFLIWLAPAAAYGGYCVWRDWPRGSSGWNPLRQTLRWGAGGVALPFAAAIWWVKFADAAKARNPAGDFLTSANLQPFNFGTWPMRLAGETWRGFFENWNHAVMPLGLMAALAVLTLILARRHAWLAVAAAGFFLLPQLVFPRLFSWHDYYFYGNALFWVVATALVIHEGFLSRWRWLGWPVLLATLGLQLGAYCHGFLPVQRSAGNGGSHLTDVLRDMTPRDSVLIVAGDDWSSIIPYYAQRRALMLRREHEQDWTLIDRAFANLAKEDVAALILVGKQRQNAELLRRTASAFTIDPVLCFTYRDADVYLSAYHRPNVVRRLQGAHPFSEVALAPQPVEISRADPTVVPPAQLKPVPDSLQETIFKNVNPKPSHYDFAMGLSLSPVDGFDVIGAHPDATLWITPQKNAAEISWEFALYQAAYEKDGGRTDGVDFIIVEKRPEGTEREIYRRTLDPVGLVADRGLQSVSLPYHPAPGARLVFMTRPHNTYSYDWAYWRKIEIK
jgi:hypothetical protein